VFSNLRTSPDSITIRNIDDSLGVYYNFDDSEEVPVLSGGPLSNKSYPLLYMQFRWKSAHMINSKQFDAEVQFVFDGPVKLSFLMEVITTDKNVKVQL
jgi:carbonic anhydrase